MLVTWKISYYLNSILPFLNYSLDKGSTFFFSFLQKIHIMLEVT